MASTAKDGLRHRKQDIVDSLSMDLEFIFNKVQEKGILTQREYNNLRYTTGLAPGDLVTRLVDKVMGKGESTCQVFVNLLKEDLVTDSYPMLKDIFFTTRGLKSTPSPNGSFLALPTMCTDVPTQESGDSKEEGLMYEMKNNPRGLCLIINNEHFAKSKDRQGTQADVGLLLATLEKLNPDDLKRFQSLLTTGQPGYPPIPESQLENADRQDTVDQMVQRYDPEGAVMITQEILRRMDQNDLAEQLWSEDRGIISGTESSKPSSSESSVIVSREEEVDERVLLDPQTQPAVSSTSTSDTETLSSEDRGIQIEPDAPDPGPAMENPAEPMEEEEDHHHAVLPHGDAGMDESQSRSPLTEASLGREFTPEILDNENQENYRFQCPHAGVFRCRITGLVFVMEGEGELLYRAISWDRRLLAHSGKRPAGPLFKFTCLKGSACQLHLAHCHIYSAGGCDFLSVAHVTDESMEFILPTMITKTHVIINIDGFSAYGNVEDEDAPISPRNALVLFFYQSPVVSDIRSILNVLLLPSNVVIKDVQRERRRRNGDKEVYIESRPHVKLTPEKYYTLSTEPPDKYTIKPKKAEFMTTDYENYFTSLSLFLRTIIEEVSLVLKEIDGTESVWEDQVWLSASTRDSAHAGVGKTSTVVSVSDLLVKALEELGTKGLKKFKRLLCQKVLEAFEPLTRGRVENSDELDMVDLMVDKYHDEGAGILTLEILKRMDKNDLAEKLSMKLDGQ